MAKEDRVNDERIKRNASGYIDPTAYNAIKNVEGDGGRERFEILLREIFDMCEDHGFALGNRIILIDKTTGRVWD